MLRLAALVCAGGLLAGCSRPAEHFSLANARTHVNVLAGAIGSRPVGTEANAKARAYLIDQLQLYGYDVRVQEADGIRPEIGLTGRVSNVIATRSGTRPAAIALVAHYDSAPDGPGAADDAFGTAVSLEAARLLAAGGHEHTLVVLLTDGEEVGLLGAAAALADPVVDDIVAYINLEAIGSSGPVVLFEAGPTRRMLDAWARRAPHPRGGSHLFALYERLPNDTDFSILRRTGASGLNLAAVGDSYAYHTDRDTPERLSDRAIRRAGENVLALVRALDREELARSAGGPATWFDIAGATGVSYGRPAGRAIALAAVLLGLAAWVRLLRHMLGRAGGWSLVFAAAWTLLAVAAVGASMVAATWMLRAAGPVYHPWYAHPDRLLLHLLAVGATAAWALVRLGALLPPASARLALRHPALVWCLALPVWVALAAAVEIGAPAAAHIWTIPLVAAGVLLLVPPGGAGLVGLVSLVALGAVGTIWLRDTVDLLRFLVVTMGRMPLVTPVALYGVLMAAVGLMVVPPAAAALLAFRTRLLHPSIPLSAGLVAVAVTGSLAYAAAAYTDDRPRIRSAHYVQDEVNGGAWWEVWSNEPGLDLHATPLLHWRPAASALPGGVPRSLPAPPFVFRAEAAGTIDPPVAISASLRRAAEADADAPPWELTVNALPLQEGLAVSIVLPAVLEPLHANLAGIRMRDGAWTATYVAPPADGVAFRMTLPSADPRALAQARLIVTAAGLPGGEGWQRLPPWLPLERTAWQARSRFRLPLPLDDGGAAARAEVARR